MNGTVLVLGCGVGAEVGLGPALEVGGALEGGIVIELSMPGSMISGSVNGNWSIQDRIEAEIAGSTDGILQAEGASGISGTSGGGTGGGSSGSGMGMIGMRGRVVLHDPPVEQDRVAVVTDGVQVSPPLQL